MFVKSTFKGPVSVTATELALPVQIVRSDYAMPTAVPVFVDGLTVKQPNTTATVIIPDLQGLHAKINLVH